LAGLLAPVPMALAQKASCFRISKFADAAPASPCLWVSASAQGKILARFAYPSTLIQSDGYVTRAISLPDSADGQVQESPGGQIWLLGTNGLMEFKDEEWQLRRVPGVEGRDWAGARFCPIRQGRVLLALPDRLLDYSSEDPEQPTAGVLRTSAQLGLGRFCGVIAGREGVFWLVAEKGVARLSGGLRNLKTEGVWQDFPVPESLGVRQLVEPVGDENGITFAGERGTNQPRSLVRFEDGRWSATAMGGGVLRRAWRGPAGTQWAVLNRTLLQRAGDQEEFGEVEEVSARQYYGVANEPGGAFWLASSEGLFHCVPLLWRCPPELRHYRGGIHGMTTNRQGEVWLAAGDTLGCLGQAGFREVPIPAGVPRPLNSRPLFALADGSLVFESAVEQAGDRDPESRYVCYRPAAGFALLPPVEAGHQLRALGVTSDGALCLQEWAAGAADGGYVLKTFDGTRLSSLSNLPPPPALGPALYCLQTLENGDVWLSGELGTARFHDRQWRAFLSSDKSAPQGPAMFALRTENRLVCATRDRTWKFDGQSWMLMRRGFDRINSMVASPDGGLWLGANNGVHRLFSVAWIDNGLSEGLPDLDVRQVCRDASGRIWAATAQGLSLFHPEADIDAPQTIIRQVSEQDSQIPEGGTVTFTFSGQDRWRITPTEQLQYSYRLDEHEWSVFDQVNGVSLADLPAGKHVFQVRAMDRAGNVEVKPAAAEFAVILPWYRETRLLLISLLGLGAALFFAGLSYNRHRRLQRSYAEVEKKIAQRTQELELAGRELLHSQKMNALGTIAAGIAHDFNNILSIIKGSAQIIEENLDNPQKVRTRLERIKTVVEQGSGIVQAMLGFSRDSGLQAAPCDLNQVVGDTIKLLGDRFLHEVQVGFEPAPALPQVLVMKDFIQQILLNLIFNAAESMPQHKRITLTTGHLENLPGGLVLKPAQAPEYVSVSVRDSGCGIPPENLVRIFEPFFTTKALSTRRGTGLGLSMVYQLASKLEAGLAVESRVDCGSTFTLILPVRSAPAQLPNAHDNLT
jgi:signal transduction histidine kinase